MEQMVRVLTEPKHALAKQYRYLFNLEDVEFHITDEALQVRQSGDGLVFWVSLCEPWPLLTHLVI